MHITIIKSYKVQKDIRIGHQQTIDTVIGWLEYRPVTPGVAGSSPVHSARFKKGLFERTGPFFSYSFRGRPEKNGFIPRRFTESDNF